MLGVTLPERLRRALTTGRLFRALASADAAAAVCRDTLSFLERQHVCRPILAYNSVAPVGLRVKDSYVSSRPFRVISVGRQILGKDLGAANRSRRSP